MHWSRRPLPRDETVVVSAELAGLGWTRHAVDAQLRAGRWQRRGRCLVLHNGPTTTAETRRVALLNAGPRAALTSFTALEVLGLTGWSRPATHIIVPGGARVRRLPLAPVVVHRARDWAAVRLRRPGVHAPAPALVLAAASLANARIASAVLAAGVQQRLVTPTQLTAALRDAPCVKYRRTLVRVVDDIAQGSHALTEIDFVALCRRHRLPEPVRQTVRTDGRARRRYLDAEFRRERDGRRLVVEVDGAVHLGVERWWSDQSRQNELVLDGTAIVLRFPSVALYTDEAGVADQLRRALL